MSGRGFKPTNQGKYNMYFFTHTTFSAQLPCPTSRKVRKQTVQNKPHTAFTITTKNN